MNSMSMNFHTFGSFLSVANTTYRLMISNFAVDGPQFSSVFSWTSFFALLASVALAKRGLILLSNSAVGGSRLF